jgi:CRP-like cAMP-binding protein
MLSLEYLDSQLHLSARAQSNCKLLWLPIKNFRATLDSHPDLYPEIIAYLLLCLHSSYRISRGLAHDRVEIRIASVLITLALKFARITRKDEYIIDITRQQLADLTGTTSETAIRVTRAMLKSEWIDIKKPGVIQVTNLDELQILIDE